MKYCTINGPLVRWENGVQVRYEAGQPFEPTQAELIAFGDVLKQAPAGASEVEQPAAGDLTVSTETDVSCETLSGPSETAVTLSQILPTRLVAALAAGGVTSLEQLAGLAADPDALAAVKGIGRAKARQIREALLAYESGNQAEEA